MPPRLNKLELNVDAVQSWQWARARLFRGPGHGPPRHVLGPSALEARLGTAQVLEVSLDS